MQTYLVPAGKSALRYSSQKPVYIISSTPVCIVSVQVKSSIALPVEDQPTR